MANQTVQYQDLVLDTLKSKTSLATDSTGKIIEGSGGGMAIGGSITSATEGSVLFAGAAGVLAQNNSAFFWDDTNKKFGVNTNTGLLGQIHSKAVDGTATISAPSPNSAAEYAGATSYIAGTYQYKYISYKTVDGTKIFSASSPTNDVTLVADYSYVFLNWEASPDTVDGYRIRRNVDSAGFNEYVDVPTGNSLTDDETVTWTADYSDPDSPTSTTDYGNAFYGEGQSTFEKIICTGTITAQTTEHSSANPSDILLTDSYGREVVGLAAWNGGGGTGGYGSVVVNSHCSAGAQRLGEIGGKNTYNGYRLGDFIFQTGSAADTGEIVALVGTGGGAFGYVFYSTSTGTMFGSGSAPSYMVDVNGDCNVSGIFRVGGVAGITDTLANAIINNANVVGGIITA